MLELINEYFNRIINRRYTYKCIAYIDDKKGGDKLVDVFEIKEFSRSRAIITAYKVISLKYPDMGYFVNVLDK